MNRTIAPAYTQAKDLDLLFPEKISLENGAEIFWIKDVKDNSVKVDIEWNAGTKYQSKKLVAGFTNKLLLSGTKTKSANQVSEEIDFYGGYTNLEVDKDHAVATIYGLKETILPIFQLFKEAFDNVDFSADELKKEADIAANRFLIDMQKGKDICRRTFNQELFGSDSAYGQVAEYEDYAALKSEDLTQFYADYYRSIPVVFVIGDISSEFMNEIQAWALTFDKIVPASATQLLNQTTGRINVPKADALQSAIRIGRLMFDKNHPDYFDFQLLNTILGGYFGSRLMANIREDKGYTYGIGSGMAVLQEAGYFFISTEVGTEVKDNTIIEIYKELNLLAEKLITTEELLKVKNYMLGEFLRDADGPNSQMEMFKNIYFNNLSPSYYQDFILAIHNCTPERLKQLSKKYFKQSEMLEVIVG